MKLTKEPDINTKITKMKQRVKWQHPQIQTRNIDQTRLVLADSQTTEQDFSFFVLGDSGTGHHRGESPQREVFEYLQEQNQDGKFILHTGDVVYLVGSREQYYANFIKPYRELLVGGENPKNIVPEKMVFKIPFFPVLGNHDYYDLPFFVGLAAGLSAPLRTALRRYIDIDVGWHGSFQGDAFAQAFIDYLKNMTNFELDHHLDKHYTNVTDTGKCLTYQPSQFTRIPNRYYRFNYGGIDFFALDSNTFNQPLPLSQSQADQNLREKLHQELEKLYQEREDILTQISNLNIWTQQDENIEQLTSDLEEIDEQINDLNKQLSIDGDYQVDQEQLDWLTNSLIASWQNRRVRGRIIFCHHPPYVTEASKYRGRQTFAVRHNLRQVFNQVATATQDLRKDQPLVNLIISGHAHCCEYLQTLDTGYGDGNLNWLICGGSGYSLRRQRKKGEILTETINGEEKIVAQSKLFIGRNGKGSSLKRPYSSVKVEVKTGKPPEIIVTPLVVEKYQGEWQRYSASPISVFS